MQYSILDLVNAMLFVIQYLEGVGTMPYELAVILILSVCLICSILANVLLVSSVPFLFWKLFRLEHEARDRMDEQDLKIETLDEVVDKTNEVLHDALEASGPVPKQSNNYSDN